MAIVQFVGFETNDFSECKANEYATISNTIYKHGSYAAKLNDADSSNESYIIVADGANDLNLTTMFIGFWFRQSGTMSLGVVPIINYRLNDGTLFLYSTFYPNDNTFIFNNASGFNQISEVPLLDDTWYYLEYKFEITGSQAYITFYVDGVVDSNVDNRLINGAYTGKTIKEGLFTTQGRPDFTMYLDSIGISDTEFVGSDFTGPASTVRGLRKRGYFHTTLKDYDSFNVY